MSSEEPGEMSASVDREMVTEFVRDETDLNKPEVRQWLDTGIDRVDSLARQGLSDVHVKGVGNEGIDGDRYQMSNGSRGEFIIINNKKFKKSSGQRLRPGSEVDEKNLEMELNRLGFKVRVYNDQTAAEMFKIMIEASRRDHSNADCFGVAFLTFGDESKIYGIDQNIAVEKLVGPIIKDCKTLPGKPKIFIFQACRSDEAEELTEVADGGPADKSHPSRRIPVQADHIYVHSGLPGPWFLRALNKTLAEHSFTMSFLTLLVRVNREIVSMLEENYVAKSTNNKTRQVPTITSTFTKDLYFTKRT